MTTRMRRAATPPVTPMISAMLLGPASESVIFPASEIKLKGKAYFRLFWVNVKLSVSFQVSWKYEDRLKIDRLEDRTSLCLVKNENFLCHINMFGTAHQPTVQGSCDHSQMTSFNHLKIG